MILRFCAHKNSTTRAMCEDVAGICYIVVRFKYRIICFRLQLYIL